MNIQVYCLRIDRKLLFPHFVRSQLSWWIYSWSTSTRFSSLGKLTNFLWRSVTQSMIWSFNSSSCPWWLQCHSCHPWRVNIVNSVFITIFSFQRLQLLSTYVINQSLMHHLRLPRHFTGFPGISAGSGIVSWCQTSLCFLIKLSTLFITIKLNVCFVTHNFIYVLC